MPSTFIPPLSLVVICWNLLFTLAAIRCNIPTSCCPPLSCVVTVCDLSPLLASICCNVALTSSAPLASISNLLSSNFLASISEILSCASSKLPIISNCFSSGNDSIDSNKPSTSPSAKFLIMSILISFASGIPSRYSDNSLIASPPSA